MDLLKKKKDRNNKLQSPSRKDLSWRLHRNIGLLVFMTFDLMILGAGVRSMDAGLTCPDWPLCFGRVVPAFHLGVYLEFIHRALAGLMAFFFFGIFVQIFRNKALQALRSTTVVGLFLLICQIIMGGLTVLKLLEFWTVTLHLMLATGFLASLFVLREKLRISKDSESPTIANSALFGLSGLGLFFVLGQMVLGALVASTYAGTICIDFPTCNGQWFPTLVGPIALQMVHRWGAYALGLFTIYFYFHSRGVGSKNSLLQTRANRFCMLVGLQFIIGILNLVLQLPPLLTVVHSALAILIFTNIFLIFSNLWLQLEIRQSKSSPESAPS